MIFQVGGGLNGLELAARYADGVYANPYTVEDVRPSATHCARPSSAPGATRTR